ncbi:uncharacterized protein TEOVI_000563200 [Trypanosoma equiperdum]|uniref:Expression site-associated gene 9 (ESAG9) protein n=1 Tax=Trypanosoma equiperdum TaxID=5694 RepID=A0A1G4I426_TRYEQ|nr:hypothetical protein TEOVI_000563200 [Trypanosoma equiperdum]
MFKNLVALLLTLRSYTASVESKDAFTMRVGVGLTVSLEKGGCRDFWHDEYGKKVCAPSISHGGSAERKTAPATPAPKKKQQNDPQRVKEVTNTDKERQEDTNPRSDGSNQPTSTAFIAPKGSEQHAQGVSGTARHRQNEKSSEPLSNAEQPGSTTAGSEQVSVSEQHSPGKGSGKGQNQGRAVTSPHAESNDVREVPETTVRSAFSGSQQRKTQEVETAPRQPIEKKKENSGMQVPRNDNEHATRPQQSSAISEPERRNTLGIATAGEDEQGSKESSVEIKNSGVVKGHAVAFSALFSFMCS